MKGSNQNLIKNSRPLAERSIRLRYFLLFIILVCIRSFYISLAGNYAGDTALYLNIANNIAAGHGFAYTLGSSSSSLVPVVGGYFPAYPALLALFELLNVGVSKIALSVGALYVVSVIYFGNAIYLITKNFKLSNVVIVVLGVSPTGLGFSRFLLIEPVLGALGILIFALCLKYYFQCGNKNQTFAFICILFVSAIYLKPTAIVFFPPICVTLLASLGLRAGLKAIMLIGGISLLLIMPWGIRNLLLGAEWLFPSHANIFPANISGITLWVKSWAVTEYDYTSALFPVWSGEIRKIAINRSLFLDENSVSRALELIQMSDKSALSLEADQSFSRLSDFLNETKPINFLRIFLLKLLQAISLLLHPANSWGFPLEISSKGNIVNPYVAQFDVFIQNIPKIAAKLFLFIWRLFFYSVLLASLAHFFGLRNSFSRLKRFVQNPDERSIGLFMVILSVSLLASSLFTFVVVFTALEHRYLYPAMPWIEAACICYVARPGMVVKHSS